MSAATLHGFLCNIGARILHGSRATHLAPPWVQHRTTYLRNGQQNPSCTPCKTDPSPYRNLTAQSPKQLSHRGNQQTARAELEAGR